MLRARKANGGLPGCPETVLRRRRMKSAKGCLSVPSDRVGTRGILAARPQPRLARFLKTIFQGLTLIACVAAAAWGQTVAPAPVPDTPAAYQDLRFPALKKIPIPNVATYTLPNGMKLYLLEDHELPIVSGTIRVRTGNLF